MLRRAKTGSRALKTRAIGVGRLCTRKEGRKEAVEPGGKKNEKKRTKRDVSYGRGRGRGRYLVTFGLASTFRLSQGYVPKDRLKRNPQKGWKREVKGRENEKARHQAKVRRKEAKSEEKSG